MRTVGMIEVCHAFAGKLKVLLLIVTNRNMCSSGGCQHSPISQKHQFRAKARRTCAQGCLQLAELGMRTVQASGGRLLLDRPSWTPT